MIFPRVYLLQNSADAGFVSPHDNKQIFDDTIVRGEPLTVAVDSLMPGLADGLQRMRVGEKRRLWIPARLAYTPPGPPQSAVASSTNDSVIR